MTEVYLQSMQFGPEPTYFCKRTSLTVILPVFKFAQRNTNPMRSPVQMPIVRVKDNEPFEIAMRRFKRSCEKAGVLAEVRRREFYEKPTAERKRKAAAAVKRHLKKQHRETRRWERTY